MKTYFTWTAAIALALPLLVANAPVTAPDMQEQLEHPANLDPEFDPLTQSDRLRDEAKRLEALYASPIHRQVRIEQRVIIRIAPASRAPRSNLMADQLGTRTQQRYEERKMDDCIAVKDISGVQPGSGNRLVLFMNDRLVSARLDKTCRARDFYSGFYVERNEDGKICVARDKLQSRSGANCELTRLRELVPVEA